MDSPSASFILIRHMRTEGGTTAGNDNPSISDTGRAEAKKLGDMLRARHIARIFSSDLKRAHETAQVLATSLGVPLDVRTELRELVQVTPEALRASEQIVTDAIDDIALRHADSAIAIVAHSGTIRTIARHLLQLPLSTYAVPSIGNGGVLVFRKNDSGAWTSAG